MTLKPDSELVGAVLRHVRVGLGHLNGFECRVSDAAVSYPGGSGLTGPGPGCDFVIGGHSVARKNVWGIANGMQCYIDDLGATPFAHFKLSGFCFAEHEKEFTAALRGRLLELSGKFVETTESVTAGVAQARRDCGESLTPCVDKFLEIYKPYCLTDVDHALRQIIAHKSLDIEPLFEAHDPLWMQKAFRQTDVTGSGHLDMAFWHLIHASSSFWDAIHTFFRALNRREIRNEALRLEAENVELRSIADLIDKELKQMFGHFCGNGMFNAWGKPYDCNSLNNIRQAIDRLNKESA